MSGSECLNYKCVNLKLQIKRGVQILQIFKSQIGIFLGKILSHKFLKYKRFNHQKL